MKSPETKSFFGKIMKNRYERLYGEAAEACKNRYEEYCRLVIPPDDMIYSGGKLLSTRQFGPETLKTVRGASHVSPRP